MMGFQILVVEAFAIWDCSFSWSVPQDWNFIQILIVQI
jgi:hypothetical protein